MNAPFLRPPAATATAFLEAWGEAASREEAPARKQSTRMRKCQCDACGFVFRATRVHIEATLELRCPSPDCDGHMLHD